MQADLQLNRTSAEVAGDRLTRRVSLAFSRRQSLTDRRAEYSGAAERPGLVDHDDIAHVLPPRLHEPVEYQLCAEALRRARWWRKTRCPSAAFW